MKRVSFLNTNDFHPFALGGCEKYPNFRVRLIKKHHSVDGETFLLADLGLPVDVQKRREEPVFPDPVLSRFHGKTMDWVVGDAEKFYVRSLLQTGDRQAAFSGMLYRFRKESVTEEELTAFLKDRELYELEPTTAAALLDEMEFLIEKLIPRSIEDLENFLWLDHRPIYWIFFEMAVDRLGLERYDDNGKPWFGQFTTLQWDGVQRYLNAGASLLDIYENTCVTKKMIQDVVFDYGGYDDKFLPEFDDEKQSIDVVLFFINGCRYKKNVTFDDFMEVTGAPVSAEFDFAVFDEGKPTLVIDSDDQKYTYVWDPIQSKGSFRSDQGFAEAKADYCRIKQIPYLKIHPEEWWGDYPTTVPSVIRKAVHDPTTACEDRELYHVGVMLWRIDALPNENRKESQVATRCGCYSCGAVFSPNQISAWHHDRAVCPHCFEDTIVFDSQGFTINEPIMQAVSERYMW